ncbi:MAG: FAD-dependent oxidoreductase [Thaumarchaeota archaeon]|nr:FAD-dependent oxidoreductase [Nitrososphaerota archaeon]
MSSQQDPQAYDVIIIGAASAGLTAALYTARQGMNTLVVTKDIGGQALLTDSIENYPGFERIGGFELMSKFEAQTRLYGTEFIYEEATQIVEEEPCCFLVKTHSGEYRGTAVILAFGKTPRDLGVPGEQELKGRGVSYCAVCDGPLFKGKVVGIAGAGDPALDAAVYLKNVVGKVYIVNRLDKMIGSEDTLETLTQSPNVEFINNSRVKSLKGSGKLEALVLEEIPTKKESELPVNGLFVEMGYIAKTDFVKDLVELNANKEIIVDKEGKTSHTGIFAAGDVTDTPYKQAVVSAGQGCTAALTAYNYVQKLRGKPAVRADWKSKTK